MASKRFANAIVARQNIHFDEWMEELRSQHEGTVPKDYVGRIAKTVLRKCDPKQFLLSHATIVASVDTFAPKKVSTGTKMLHGCQIDVRWPDFRIKPECHEIINNNGDAWERSLLLSSYRTFIGAHNYLEHIQLPELSKGFIVDAIARDLGKTCYVDILVATDRKHRQLITDILSGQIAAMSMGCISLFTTCTACGNVASDDSQLCPCVQFVGKGKMAVDEDGVQFPIAELIGHVSIPNSNQFIEASWVRNPAFRGAVRRQILNPEASASVAAQLNEVAAVYEIRRHAPDPDGVKKAASLRTAQGDDAAPQQGQSDPPADDSGADDGVDLGDAPDSGGSDNPGSGGGGVDEMMQKAQEQLLQMLIKSMGEKLAPKPEDVGTAGPAPSVEAGNDNLVMSSRAFAERVRKTFPGVPKMAAWAYRAHLAYRSGPRAVRAAGLTARDLVVLSWIEDRVASRVHPPALYKLAMSVGPIKDYPSGTSFLAACSLKLGRRLSEEEKGFLFTKGKMASRA